MQGTLSITLRQHPPSPKDIYAELIAQDSRVPIKPKQAQAKRNKA